MYDQGVETKLKKRSDEFVERYVLYSILNTFIAIVSFDPNFISTILIILSNTYGKQIKYIKQIFKKVWLWIVHFICFMYQNYLKLKLPLFVKIFVTNIFLHNGDQVHFFHKLTLHVFPGLLHMLTCSYLDSVHSSLQYGEYPQQYSQFTVWRSMNKRLLCSEIIFIKIQQTNYYSSKYYQCI